MSSAAAAQLVPGDGSPQASSQSFLRRVTAATLVRRTAVIGLVWIALLAFLAVFAPFIASTHPILLKEGGRWSSPILARLTDTDVILLALALTLGLLALLRHLAWPARLGYLAILAATLVLTTSWTGGVAYVLGLLHQALGPYITTWLALAAFVAVLLALPGRLPLGQRTKTALTLAAALAAALATGWIMGLHGGVLERNLGSGVQWGTGRILWLTTPGPAQVLRPLLVLAGLVWAISRLLSATRKPWVAMVAMAAMGLWFALCALPLVMNWMQQDGTFDYKQYRAREAAGQTQFVLRTLIPYSPTDRLADRGGNILQRPGPWWAGHPGNHWLGTEASGADVASRLIHASRIALSVGFISTGIAVIIGIFVGGLMGYYSGTVDLIGMRFIEIIQFIPQLFLLLMFVAFFNRNIYFMMVIIGLTSWVGYARFVRAEFLKLRQQDFVQAAAACGLPLRSILFKHMLPNGLTPVLVGASFGVASAILAESTLSFLGLGLIEEPSWGALLNQATRGSTFVWWIAIFPGLAIFLTVFAYNLVGEALRDAIDPYTNRDRAA